MGGRTYMIHSKNITYDIVDRYISIPVITTTFAVMGDNVSRYLTFRISKYFDNVDLSKKQIYICYKTASNTTGESLAVNIKYSNSILEFDWAVPSEVTTSSGTVEFYIEFREVNEENQKVYCLKTKSITHDVEKSFNVNNTAEENDYTIEKLFLHDNSTHINRTDLIDSELPSKVVDRDIIINTAKIIAVMKDNMSQILTFRLKRKVDGIDRANKTFCIKFLNAKGESDISIASNVFIYDEEINIGWALDSKVTKHPGTVKFEIAVLGYLEDGSLYSWHTKPAKFVVEGGLDVDSNLVKPAQSWFDSWVIEADNILQQSAQFANQSKTSSQSIETIKADVQQLANTATHQATLSESYANQASDAIAAISDLYITRTSKDDIGIFKIVNYYRQDSSLYMVSELKSIIDTYDQRTEIRYKTDGVTIYDTKHVPIIRDMDGIVIGRMGNLSQLQYHGLI
jgi:hypothetical protein